MKAFWKLGAITLMALTVVACRPTNRLNSVDGLTRSSELWSDVPKMEGLSPSTLEPPLFVKLLMKSALNDIFGKGGTNKGDWIGLVSGQTPDEVRSFYTNERMAAS